jgi:hypothetical protein
MRADPIQTLLEQVYEMREGCEDLQGYIARHGIQSAGVLTVYTDEVAGLIAERLAPRIEGRTVVEIGGGIGLLACYLGRYAKRVYCIEANPDWAGIFANILLKIKPKNVSYLFGAADEFSGMFGADIAVICTHSGLESMKRAALMFAPEVVDVYGELIRESPESYDATARELRKIV